MDAKLKSGKIVSGKLADVFTKIGIAKPIDENEYAENKKKKYKGRPKKIK